MCCLLRIATKNTGGHHCSCTHRFCFSFNKCSLSWETHLTASEETFCDRFLLLEVYLELSAQNCQACEFERRTRDVHCQSTRAFTTT